ncbi:transcriptional regulator NosR [Pseudomonas citronellolis]|uniref:transcriptional regulator NosR n=1 Tax=Pseudomonas citronellolis TaxID=53408 RepID=UPI0023E3CB93|nr:NosR/NirI family protein [Pseudomonas citronellolis]MDF3931119.1 4Fe-4S binding protein [Pseudomonas citronellolis]
MRRIPRRLLWLVGWWLLLVGLAAQAAAPGAAELARIRQTLPGVERIGEPEGEYGVRHLSGGGQILGYAFQTLPLADIPAYSGKPVNLQVILDPRAVILDVYVLEHHEPILLVGIAEEKLHAFAARYTGVRADQRVVVGRSADPAAVTVDAVAGATVTVMVINEIVMRAARKVALSLGLIASDGQVRRQPAQVRHEPFKPASWDQLLEQGAIAQLHLRRGQVDDAFRNTPAEGRDATPSERRDETFVELYTALLDPPDIGRNLLGEAQYRELMASLRDDEHAIVVLGNGEYSFKGSGYVRGGIFDRVQLRQAGDILSFRDLDYQRLADVYAAGMPRFAEMAIFIVRAAQRLDPGQPWSLELLVRRQAGAVSSAFASFELPYRTPERYLQRPPPSAAELAAETEARRPLWLRIWYQKAFQIGVLGAALALLLGILFAQDALTRRPRLLHALRRGYLLFTLLFIGWYCLGQLSLVNVLTFVHALFGDLRWELFLSDPVLFILWTFTAASALLWGRGVFCGWLCPFGALQELLNEAARKLGVRQFEPPFALHERLWALKYLILFGLFGLSLHSLALAERAAEVEPFKTAITLRFDRQWWFLAYALALLAANLFTRKLYCRYLCPLGAALALPARARLFDWLRRRQECGRPCQLCARECEIQAIHPDGRIDASECHHCLDCQITYHNQNRCPPLVKRHRKGAARKPADQEPIAVQQL